MATERQVSIVETRSVTSGFIDSTTEAKALDAAIDGVTESSKQLTQSEISLQGALDRLDAKYNEATRSANEYARTIDLIARARKQGVGNEEQYARVLAGLAEKQAASAQRAAGSMRQLGGAANDNAKNFGLASHQLQNLGFQLNDLVVQIGSGGGIFRPLLQQGAQVHQILSTSEGGVGGVLSKVGTALRAVGPAALLGFGATTAAIGGTIVAIGAATVALKEYYAQQQQIQRATTSGAGRLQGIGSGAVQSAAEAASASSTRTSIADMRNAALELVKTGKIGKETMGEALGIVEDFANTLGVDTVSAAKKLGAALADPSKGIKDLAGELKGFSGAQIEAVAAAQRAGDTLGAQRLAVATIKTALVDTKTEIRTWSNVWEEATKKAGDSWDRFVQKIGKGSQIQLPDPEQEIARIRNLPRPATQGEGAEQRAKDVEARIAELQKEIEGTAAKAEQARLAEAGALASQITESLDPVGTKFKEVEDQANKLRAALANPLTLGDPTASIQALEKLTVLMGGATNASEARAVALQREAQAHQLQLDAIRAVTLEEQASVAAKQAALQAELQGAGAVAQNTAALRARELVVAQANATTQQQLAQGALALQQIQVETQATLAQTDAERQAVVVAQADLAFQQAYAAAIAARLGQENALLLAEQARNQVMAQGNAARAVRMQQMEQEIAAGARELAQQQLNIQSQNAYTAAEQQAAAAAQAQAAAEEAKRDALARGATAKQAAIKAEQAHTKVMEEFESKVDAAVKAADRLIRANELQLRAINATTVAARAKIAAEQSMLDTENSLMTMTQRLTIAEQERQKVLQQAEASVRQMIVAQEGQLHLLEASISSIGMERAAREALLAGIRAENELRQMGIDIGSASAQQYIRNAEAIGSMTVELERAEAAQRRLTSATEAYGRTAGRTILGASEATWRGQMDTLNQALAGGGGFQAVEAASPLRTAEATVKAHNKAVEAAQASEEAAKAAADAAKASKDAVDNLDTGAIGTEIDRLRSLQEAALSRAYRPDPYAEKNPEFFYNGEQIMKAAQDKIFDGLQTQIEKLQGLQASIGTLIAQGAQLPQTLVNALIAAGFGNIARDIADALTPTSIASATPNPTSVMWTIDDVLPEGAARQPIYKEFVTRGIMGSAVSVNRINFGRQ